MEREESLQQFKAYLDRRFPDRRTSKDYVSDLNQFMIHCSKAWREVTMHDIDSFVDQQRQKGLKAATVSAERRQSRPFSIFWPRRAETTIGRTRCA